jgi:RND family efflux transporter MFP subunit
MASGKWARRAVTSGGGLAVAGVLAFGAYSFPQVLPKSLANLIRPTAVSTAVVQVAPVSEAVYGTGTVEPERWAKVVPLQRRRLVEICRCEGQAVKAGQVLARQDDAEERNLLQELEINHEQLDRNLRRAQTDRSKGDITAAELEQRETAFDQSKSRIAAQRSRLDTLVLRAPMDGLVLRRDGEVGEIVGPTEVPFWVGQPTPLHVVAEINEEEIVKVAVGQKVFLRTEAFEGQALRADVSQITPKGDPTRKTFRVYLRLPQQTPLRIGMTVEANIIFREKQAAMVVPAEAVVANAVQEVGDNGRLRRVPVTVGVKGSRSVEVSGELSRGAVVLSPGRPDLAERTKVASSNRPEETAVAATPAGGNNATPDRDMHPAGAQTREVQPTGEPEDYHTSALRSAVSAHIESVVLDARRNAHKYR